MTESTQDRARTTRTPAEALRALDSTSRRSNAVHDNVDILGVVGGIKPMALLFGRTDIEPLLQEMNLVTHLDSPRRPESGRPPFLVVARDPSTIDQYSALKKLDEEEKHRALGKLLGYPETATDYFLRRYPTIDNDDALPMVYPKWLEGTVHQQLHQFVLSPDHYEEEIAAYIDPLHDAVKEHGPRTYRALEAKARAVRRRKATQRVFSVLGFPEKQNNNFPIQNVTKR